MREYELIEKQRLETIIKELENELVKVNKRIKEYKKALNESKEYLFISGRRKSGALKRALLECSYVFTETRKGL